MAEVVGLVLSVLGGADVCVGAGRNLYGMYRTYKDVEQELNVLRLRLKTHWFQIESKIAFLKELDHVLPENLKIHFSELFELLNRRLEDAKLRLGSVERKQSRLKRVKFAALIKATLEETIGQLDRWQVQLEWPWFLMARISNPLLDEKLTPQRTRASDSALTILQLRQNTRQTQNPPSVFISATDLSQEQTIPAPFPTNSPISLATIYRNNSKCTVLVNIISPPTAARVSAEDVKTGVRDIARALSNADPMAFGILACHGVVELSPTTFKFLFDIPDRLRTPISLRSLLVDSGAGAARRPMKSLNDRFELARRLAKSVMFVHSANMVHKNIRPDTVVIFKDSTTGTGIPFLVGFEKIRAVNAYTHLTGETDWERNLYRHPNRQGVRLEETYKMQHDIYSLGVCLLEIGLWSSFTAWSQQGSCWVPGEELEIGALLGGKDQRRTANAVKDALMEMAERLLPGAMGSRYAGVVVACLGCLDKGNTGFGGEEEFRDPDGISVGVRYVEKVLMGLQEIEV